MLVTLISLCCLILLTFIALKMNFGQKEKANQPINSGAPEGSSKKVCKSSSKIPKPKVSTDIKERPKSTPKLHALGKVPKYILKLRPKSSSNGEPSKQKVESPPTEGTILKEADLKDDSKLHNEEIIAIKNLEGKDSSKKTISMQKQEVINELSQYLRTARISPSDDPELTIAKLRRELAQKSAVLVENRKLSFKIKALEQQLLHEAHRLSDKDQRILKLQQESLGLGDRIRELKKTMTKFQQDLAAKERLIAEKDVQISNLQANEVKLTDLEEIEKLQTEVDKQSSYVMIPLDVDKPEDALDEVRKRVLNVIKSCKQAFKERCEEFSRLEGAGDAEQSRFDAVFETMADKQRQCCQKEDEIKSLRWKNRQCRAHRAELLGVLKKLMEENKQLRDAETKKSKVFKILKESTSNEGNGDVFEDAASDFGESCK